MKEEALMKILEMVGQAGEGGFALALVYLLYDYFSSIMFAATVITIVVVISRLVYRSLSEETLLKKIGDKVEFGWYGNISHSETRELLKKLDEGLSR